VDGNIHIKEDIYKKQPIRITALTQHGSSERSFRRECHVHEALLVIRNHCLDMVDHDAEV
jgi:hypothetical protein